MGFEMVRRMPDGTEETQVIVIQNLLDEAEPLDMWSHHCIGCPANRSGKPYGCYGSINYPISRAAELWLLKQIPSLDEPLPFLLLNQTMKEFSLTGKQGIEMRSKAGVFFETSERFGKPLEDTQITSDQVFEMLFLNGMIQPAHGALLLIFFGAIPRDGDAQALMSLTEVNGNRAVPFLLKPDPTDDASIAALKDFFEALYIAWQLNVTLSLDA
jgi:hypothetical protein